MCNIQPLWSTAVQLAALFLSAVYLYRLRRYRTAARAVPMQCEARKLRLF